MERVLQLLEHQDARLKAVMVQQDRIVRALRSMGSHMELLGVVRDLFAAAPPGDWNEVPEWAQPILAKLRHADVAASVAAEPESVPQAPVAAPPNPDGPLPMVSVTAERVEPAGRDIPSIDEMERMARRDVEDGKPVGDARTIVPADPVPEAVIEVQP